ncbi:MAG: aminotransferase class I/II-fold pyridoxal phosphate-dependent enzyme [Microthrixaceae bacterium]
MRCAERDETVRTAESSLPETCHLEVGQPAAGPPAVALRAAQAAMAAPHGYTDSLGMPELRSRIAEFHRERHGTEVDPERVVITSGASAGCVLALAALADPGDAVVVTEPGYPATRTPLACSVSRSSRPGSTPRPGTASPRRAGCCALDAGSAALVVASPANPTGSVLTRSDLADLHRWCEDRGTTMVVDEIYHGTSSERLPSATGFPDAVVMQSFSKYFCMTGWRLGWMVVPEQLVRPVERLSQNLYLAPPTLSQWGALAALGATRELDELATSYRSNAKILEDVLRSHGVVDIAPAEGAFYVWADLGEFGDSTELCSRWLREIGVAATPGHDFDGHRGHRFVRFSVAGDAELINEAAARLDRWFTTAPRDPFGSEQQ